MKKLFHLFITTAIISLSACNGATQKTGGEARDSSASHGNSGPADSSMATESGSPVGASTSGSDTSTNGKSTANPTVDSGKTNKP
ncbi:hypothetical protein [Mucilaginibacter agri]|uniref:Uncharacterized protein n=1 Tax=Mucilaginibacter agri TaxID=2695265 RepID=A0A966DU79_9SPHI|nr:hypothetical protein [Mucilaginibacter agri]NCD69399.1 hypothetical protein [Mucilaginibacter agri]